MGRFFMIIACGGRVDALGLPGRGWWLSRAWTVAEPDVDAMLADPGSRKIVTIAALDRAITDAAVEPDGLSLWVDEALVDAVRERWLRAPAVPTTVGDPR